MRGLNKVSGGLMLAAMAGMLATAPVSAKKKKIVVAGPPITMSDTFRASAADAEAALKARDTATAASRISALMPTTDFEAYVAAGMRYQLAVQRRDVQAQRLALTDLFKTTAVPRTEAPRLRFVAGYLSFMVGNYDDATAQLDYAKTLGYDGIDAIMLRADIALRRNKPKEARPLLREALARQRASGQEVPLAWIDRAISMAYQAEDWNEVGALYRERLARTATPQDWRSALTNYLSAADLESQAQLDLYRLQAANGAMASERDYQAYAQLAEKAGFYAEAKAIIEAGRKAGKLTAKQPATSALLGMAQGDQGNRQPSRHGQEGRRRIERQGGTGARRQLCVPRPVPAGRRAISSGLGEGRRGCRTRQRTAGHRARPLGRLCWRTGRSGPGDRQ